MGRQAHMKSAEQLVGSERPLQFGRDIRHKGGRRGRLHQSTPREVRIGNPGTDNVDSPIYPPIFGRIFAKIVLYYRV